MTFIFCLLGKHLLPNHSSLRPEPDGEVGQARKGDTDWVKCSLSLGVVSAFSSLSLVSLGGVTERARSVS